jgi:hypothetical protein
MDTHEDSTSNASGSRVGSAPEVHNASVDENAAAQGGCGQLHLPTGAMCTLRHGHEGSCEFSPAAEVATSLAEHRAAEQW